MSADPMKVALVLFGISYKDAHKPAGGGRGWLKVDFRSSVENYGEKLIRFFNISDIITATYDYSQAREPRRHYRELLAAYQPKESSFNRYPSTRDHLLAVGLKSLQHFMRQNATKYDMVIATRFDLEFRVPFESVTIDRNSMNVVARLNDGRICDNFYMFPVDHLQRMISFVDRPAHLLPHSSHDWEAPLVEIFGRPLHFLTVDSTWIGGLRFYRIVRDRADAEDIARSTQAGETWFGEKFSDQTLLGAFAWWGRTRHHNGSASSLARWSWTH